MIYRNVYIYLYHYYLYYIYIDEIPPRMNSEIFRQNEESNTKIRKSIKKKSNTTVITPTILNQGTLPIISLFDIKPKRFKKVYNILLFIYSFIFYLYL